MKKSKKKGISAGLQLSLALLTFVIVVVIAIRIDYNYKKKLCKAKADLYGSKTAVFSLSGDYCLIEIHDSVIDINI